MRHCHNCNRNYSDKYFRKPFGVEYIYKKKENILVNEIDNTLSDIIDVKLWVSQTCSTMFFFYINDECK